ncbi:MULTISPECIES: PaaI family thioesterase [unclassified Luteococcus]|uniref:PaaI family thioesterase n=1 Tax=unclassified Luteococcus TaxID=2639923 RepID=UPI00313CA741
MSERMIAPFRTHNQIVWDGEVVRCATQPNHANVGGGIHGGLISAMLDAVMGGNVILQLPADKAAVTSSMTVNYLRAGRIGDTLVASAVVRKVGRTLAYVDGTCTKEGDPTPLATASGVFAIVRRPTERPLVRY